jgi:hypothetical protein
LENHVTNPNTNEYKLTVIVVDIAGHRLFKPVGIMKDEILYMNEELVQVQSGGLDLISSILGSCNTSL